MCKDLKQTYDIIIDNGYQNFFANYNTAINCLGSLKENGIYIIENITAGTI